MRKFDKKVGNSRKVRKAGKMKESYFNVGEAGVSNRLFGDIKLGKKRNVRKSNES